MSWFGKGKEPTPEKQAKADSKKHSYDDAFCTECLTWYNSSDQKQVDRHAH